MDVENPAGAAAAADAAAAEILGAPPAPQEEKKDVTNDALALLEAAARGAGAGGDGPRKRVRSADQEINELQSRVDLLVQAADSIEASLDDNDAQAIYGEYQNTKRQLSSSAAQLNQLRNRLETAQRDLLAVQLQRDQALLEKGAESEAKTAANAELEARQRELDQVTQGLNGLRARIDTLQRKMDSIQTRLTQTKTLRGLFGVPQEQAVGATTMSNYFGVYTYNEMLGAARKALAQVQQQPLDQRPVFVSAEDVFDNVVRPALTAVREQEVATQTEYAAQVQSILDEAPEGKDADQARWVAELAVVKARYEPNGGSIGQAFELALTEARRDPRMLAAEQDLVAQAANFPVGVGTNYVLQGIANTRMFENDILPEQATAGQQESVRPGIGQDTAEFATMRASLDGDKRWRVTSAADKQALLNQALAWADDAKVPPARNVKDTLVRMLEGVAAKLGLRFFQYAPTELRSPDLVAAAAQWDAETMTLQMQSACRENPGTREPQKVIKRKTWNQEMLAVAAGKNRAVPGVIAWLLMERTATPTKLFGIVQGRDARRIPDVTTGFRLETTEVGRSQGVPELSPDTLQQSVDLTFLCAQRLRSLNGIDYSINGQSPNQLGTLMVLWFLVNLVDAGYLGAILEVVGKSGNTEGVSNAPANSAVAAYYHRYFKFQRSDSLQFFAQDPSLLAFHNEPEWNAYRAVSTTGKELDLEIMYRPYPTVADLRDMIARLVQKVVQYYRF